MIDLQQCLDGFKTTAVIGGPLTVRVHKALDNDLTPTPTGEATLSPSISSSGSPTP